MKAKYKPIAMKCNQEQFDSIKHLITVLDAEIEALQRKAKELGMKLTILIE